ncbi:MAG: GNAT family N-acetyltransferase [Thiohalocapsa sp.]|jgi:putative acetyltransferase|uniref:GNAT family N-acetyltransferase n=1 Tax=Thiohalocapsa sp. TaxID=2497641 RepID=UPI0025CD4BDC|nr:GNAT family N-acetyltransferase [Thiohalocapsa sp.]MCG6941499.1 GNAT family N-acetyltransferase [Thiohalocapsa sp.]
MTYAMRHVAAGEVPALRAVYADAVRGLAPGHYAPEQVVVWAGFAASQDFTGFVLDVMTFVAVAHGDIVGFCGIGPDGHVASIYVHPAHARRGIASALLRRALAACPAPDAGRWLAEASLLSRPLFQRFGFRQTGVERALRDGVGFERYIMARVPDLCDGLRRMPIE